MRWNGPLVVALCHFEHRGQFVGFQFIWAEDAERVWIALDDSPQVFAELLGVANQATFYRTSLVCSYLLNGYCKLEDVGKIKVSTYAAAKGMRVTAHATVTLWTL